MNPLSRAGAQFVLTITELAVISIELDKEFGFRPISKEMPQDPMQLINYLKKRVPILHRNKDSLIRHFIFIMIGILGGAIILIGGLK
jgi:hypothetical protein